MKQQLIEFFLKIRKENLFYIEVCEIEGLTPDEISILLKFGEKYYRQKQRQERKKK